MSGLQTMDATLNSGLSENELAKLKRMRDNMQSAHKKIEKNTSDYLKSAGSGGGFELFAFVVSTKEGEKRQNSDEVKRGSNLGLMIIELPKDVSPTYGLIEADNENGDPTLEGLPIHKANGQIYDPIKDSRGELVLKAKVRDHLNAEKQKWTKSDTMVSRPISRVVYVRPGDTIYASIFQAEIPKDSNEKAFEPGSLVSVRGAVARQYVNNNGNIQTSWNIKSVLSSPHNVEAIYTSMMKRSYLKIPRNSHSFMRIEQAPDEKNTPYEERKPKSDELKDLLDSRVLFCSWATDLSDPKRQVVEMRKKANIIWDKPVFGEDQKNYGDTVIKEGEPDRHYSRIIFMVTSTVSNEDNDPPEEMIIHDVRLGETQVRQFMGMADCRRFVRIAQNHVPNMKFAVIGRVDHKETFNAEFNKESMRPEEQQNISYKLVWRPPKASFALTNLREYIANNGYPVNFDFVKEMVGGDSLLVKSPHHAHNFYNNLPGSNFFNLSEYDGDLTKFQSGWQFRVIDTRGPDELRLGEVRKIEDDQERVSACSASLLGKGGQDNKLRLGTVKEKDIVVFALRDDLVADINANPSAYNMQAYIDEVERVHADHDPSTRVRELESRKRAREREAVEEQIELIKKQRTQQEDDEDDDDEDSVVD